MSRIKYEQIWNGEWFRPTMRGHKEMCCTCKLVHRVDYRIVDDGKRRHIEIKASVDDRGTTAARRNKKP